MCAMNLELPKHFRKLTPIQRIAILQQLYSLSEKECSLLLPLNERADAMVEVSIGTFSIPLGLATGLVVNGQNVLVPMATEEPSVIAAASYAATLVQGAGGFTASAEAPLLAAQIFIENGILDALTQKQHCEISQRVNALLPGMVQRGGGFHDASLERLPSGVLCITLELHVGDAMGANIVNSVAEQLKPYFCDLTHGQVVMAIVTNSCRKRLARASFALPVKFLRGGAETCRKIVMANHIAIECPDRAVTHNKGIMNGITALALATGNDTRAIEAAAHHHACQKPLTRYTFDNGVLQGILEMPLPFGTVGGAMQSWPSAQLALKLLHNPSAAKLSQIAAALGLAQNLAALYALVTEGIQLGHMRLHAKRKLFVQETKCKQ